MLHQFFCISFDDYTSGEFVGATLLRKRLCQKNDRSACDWSRTPEIAPEIEKEKERFKMTGEHPL